MLDWLLKATDNIQISNYFYTILNSDSHQQASLLIISLKMTQIIESELQSDARTTFDDLINESLHSMRLLLIDGDFRKSVLPAGL